MLAEISMVEHEAGRPPLSALVKVQNPRARDNFYKLCEKWMGERRTPKQDEEF
jgi:hypothetical protein